MIPGDRRSMKAEEQPIIPAETPDLIPTVSALHNERYRLVAISTTKLGEQFQVDYSFDRDFSFRTLRLSVPQGTTLPSITGIYWAAFPYENEMHDLFGLTVTGIAVDFKGTFIKTAIQYPFSVTTVKPGDEK
jgi:ech hydrogenase subunit D